MQDPRTGGNELLAEAEGVVRAIATDTASSSATTASPTSISRRRKCAPCCTATASRAHRALRPQGPARGAHPRDRRAPQGADHRPPAQRGRRLARRAGRPALRPGHPDPEERHRRPPWRARWSRSSSPSRRRCTRSRSAASPRCWARSTIPAWRSRSRCASTRCRIASRRETLAQTAKLPDHVRAADMQGPHRPAPTCRSSPSTARTRATSTTPSTASRTSRPRQERVQRLAPDRRHRRRQPLRASPARRSTSTPTSARPRSTSRAA